MLKKDYLLRQFEEFGKVLGHLLGLKRENDWEKFEKELADAGQKFTALEIKSVEEYSIPEFEREVLSHPTLTQEQRIILGTLLFEKMSYYAAMDDRENYINLKNKCLSLYKLIRENFTENEFNLDVHYKIEFLSKIED